MITLWRCEACKSQGAVRLPDQVPATDINDAVAEAHATATEGVCAFDPLRMRIHVNERQQELFARR